MASNFYRRPLPERCVDLASEEGKKLFTAALEQGWFQLHISSEMDSYKKYWEHHIGNFTLMLAMTGQKVK